jgi:hypothetical protein
MSGLTFFAAEVEGLGSVARTCLEACFLALFLSLEGIGLPMPAPSISGPAVLLDVGLKHHDAPCDEVEKSTCRLKLAELGPLQLGPAGLVQEPMAWAEVHRPWSGWDQLWQAP